MATSPSTETSQWTPAADETSVNGATEQAVKPPVLRIGESAYQCRDLESITYNEQIQANQILDKMGELYETMREYQELDDDDDEWGDLPEVPEELEEAWRRFHKRVVRYAYPEAPKSELQELSPAQVAHASSQFTNYLARYGQHLLDEGDQGGKSAEKSGNRKSRRASRKTSRA